jgi:hypothetical protein
MRLVIVNIIIAFAFATFPGCIESPVQQDSYVVNGMIYQFTDYYLISAGEYPFTVVTYDEIPEFKVTANSKPYDINILGFYYPSRPIFTLKYKNLTTNSVHIAYDDENLSYYYEFFNLHPCYTTVYFPPLTEREMIAIKFISNETFLQTEDKKLLDTGTGLSGFYIEIPKGKSSITGKIYFLEIKIDNETGDIISFDKFGIKDITCSLAGMAI